MSRRQPAQVGAERRRGRRARGVTRGRRRRGAEPALRRPPAGVHPQCEARAGSRWRRPGRGRCSGRSSGRAGRPRACSRSRSRRRGARSTSSIQTATRSSGSSTSRAGPVGAARRASRDAGLGPTARARSATGSCRREVRRILGRHEREARPVAHVLEHLAEPGPALAPQPVERRRWPVTRRRSRTDSSGRRAAGASARGRPATPRASARGAEPSWSRVRPPARSSPSPRQSSCPPAPDGQVTFLIRR